MSNPALDPPDGDLALQAPRLRRLARGLVGDAHAAEDIIQEAWLRGRTLGTSGEKLPALVRNLASSWRRSEGRLRQRERVSALAEGLPSAAEVAARAEWMRRIAEALEQLAEPYRTTLLLRYYDELTATEIGRRSGVPASTVRTRIQRGLAQLRRQLDEQAESRSAWMLVLGPWLRPECSPSIPATLGGVIFMKSALLVLVAVSSLVLTWTFWPRQGQDSIPVVASLAEKPEDEVSRRVTESPGAKGSDRAVPLSPDDQPTTTASPRQAFRARLRALDPNGQPLSGAWLHLWGRSAERARSDEAGELELSVDATTVERFLESSRDSQPAFLLGAAGRVTRFLESPWPVRPVGLEERPEAILDLGSITLKPGGTVRGRVVDASGLGVEGVPVVWGRPVQTGLGTTRSDESRHRSGPGRMHPEAWNRGPLKLETRSGPGGQFEIDGIEPGHGTLWARASMGLWSWSPPVGIRAGETRAGFELILSEGTADLIVGRVLDPQRNPVPSAKVTFQADPSQGWTTVYADVEGCFYYAPEGPEPLSIWANPPSWEWEQARVNAVAPGTLDVELVFESSRWVLVDLRATDGTPLPGGRVTGVPGEGATDVALPRCESTLDDSGRGRLRLAPGLMRVRAEAPGYRSLLSEPFDPLESTGPLTLFLEPLPALVGQVLKSDGQPAAGARVRLHRGLSMDADGASWRLTHQGWSGDREPFVYRMQSGSLTEVRADEEGFYRLPLPGVDARANGEVKPSDDHPFRGFSSKEAGEGLRRADPQGPWYIHADGTDGGSKTLGPLSFAPEREAHCDVELEDPGGSIDGQLILGEGRSSRGWVMWASDGGAELRKSNVDLEGRFRFEGLHPGGWQVRAFAPGTRFYKGGGNMLTDRAPEPDVFVAAGHITNYVYEAELPGLAKVNGRLWIDDQAPGPWRVVMRTSTPQSSIRSYETTLDPDGRFTLEVEAGLKTSLSLMGGVGGALWTVSAQPQLAVGDYDWSCDLASAEIQGWLRPGDARPTRFDPGPQYKWEQDGVRVRVALSADSNGLLASSRVPAGAGELHAPLASPRNDPRVLTRLSLEAGQTQVLDLR